jgi:hypothetical protein
MNTTIECQVRDQESYVTEEAQRRWSEPEGMIPNVIMIKHVIAESSRPKEIRIVLGSKDQYEVH